MQAYDQHLNMILGDVEEIVTSVEIDDETYEEIVRVCSLNSCLYDCLCITKKFVNQLNLEYCFSRGLNRINNKMICNFGIDLL